MKNGLFDDIPQAGGGGLFDDIPTVTGDGMLSSPIAQAQGAMKIKGGEDIARIIKSAGFSGDKLATAIAVVMAESSGNPRAHNPNRSTGDNSYGLFQINMLDKMGPERRKKYGLKANEDLFDPTVNARVAYLLSGGGKNWKPWTTYTKGKYKRYLSDAKRLAAAVESEKAQGGKNFLGNIVSNAQAGLEQMPRSPQSQSPFALVTGEINRRVEKFREDTAPRQRVGGIPVPINTVTELQRQGAENIPTQAIDPRMQQMLGLQGIQPPPVIPQRKSPTIQPVEQTLVRGKIIEEERKPGYWERLQRDLGLTSLKDFRTSVGNFTNELTGVLEKYGVGQVAGSLAFASPIGSAAALTGTPGSQVYDAGAKIGSSIAANLLNAPLESAAGFAAIVDPEATATEKFWGGLDLALTLIPGAVIAKSGKQAVRALDRLKFAVKGRNADAVKMAIQDAIDSGININQIFKNAPTALDRQLAALVKGTDEAGDIAATFRPKKDQNAIIKEEPQGATQSVLGEEVPQVGLPQAVKGTGKGRAKTQKEVTVPESTQPVATVPKTEPAAPKGAKKEPWEMTQAEFRDANKRIEQPARPLTLNEWRAENGREVPLTDHGGYKYPHGISKAERRRIDDRLRKKNEGYEKSSAEYYKLLNEGKIRMVTPVRTLEGASGDLESNQAFFRVQHKRAITKALSEGKPVPAEVLADYPNLAKKYATTTGKQAEAPKVEPPSTTGLAEAVREAAKRKPTPAGKPLTMKVFHGKRLDDGRKITDLDPGKARGGEHQIFVTPNRKHAAEYGVVVEGEVSLKKPFVTDNNGWVDREKERIAAQAGFHYNQSSSNAAEASRLFWQEYDGVVLVKDANKPPTADNIVEIRVNDPSLLSAKSSKSPPKAPTTGKQAEVGNAPTRMVETPTVPGSPVKFSDVATDLKGKDRREALRAQRAAKIQQAAEGGEMQASSIYNPEDLEYFYEVAKTYVEDGIKFVDDIAKRMKADGDDLPKEVRQRLVKEGLIEPPVKGTQKARTATEGGGQGISQGAVGKLREEIGLPGFEKTKKTDAELASAANDLRGQEAGIARQIETPDKVFSPEESVALGRRLSVLRREMEAARKSGDVPKWNRLSEEAELLADALDESGSRQGRAFRARRFVFQNEYDAWTLNRRLEKQLKNAGITDEIPEDIQKRLQEMSDRVTQAEAAVTAAKEDANKWRKLYESIKPAKQTTATTKRAERMRSVALSDLRKLGIKTNYTGPTATGGGMPSKKAGAIQIKAEDGDKVTRAIRSLVRAEIEDGNITDLDSLVRVMQERVPDLDEDQLWMILSNEYRIAQLDADIAKLEVEKALGNVVDAAKRKRMPKLKLFGNYAWDTLNVLSRTLQSGLDISAPFIQGANALMMGDFRLWAKSWGPMVKALGKNGGEPFAVRQLAEFKRHPLYSKFRKAGLDLTEMGGKLSLQEENYAGHLMDALADMPNQTGLGLLAKAYKKSEAAFNAFNNQMRMGYMLRFAESAPQGVPDAELAKFYEDAAMLTNIITGRGSGTIAKTLMGSQAAGTIFYAPRFLWSTFQLGMGYPIFFAKTSAGRKLAIKQYVKLAGTVGTLVGMAKFIENRERAAEREPWIMVDTDIRSSRWGRIILPKQNVEIDLFGRAAAPARLIAQMTYGKISRNGNYMGPGKYGSTVDAPLRFTLGKLSPLPKVLIDAATNDQYNFRTEEAEPFSGTKQLTNAVLPITWKNIYDDVSDPELSKVQKLASLIQIAGFPMQQLPKKVSGKSAPPLKLKPPAWEPKKQAEEKSPLPEPRGLSNPLGGL